MGFWDGTGFESNFAVERNKSNQVTFKRSVRIECSKDFEGFPIFVWRTSGIAITAKPWAPSAKVSQCFPSSSMLRGV